MLSQINKNVRLSAHPRPLHRSRLSFPDQVLNAYIPKWRIVFRSFVRFLRVLASEGAALLPVHHT